MDDLILVDGDLKIKNNDLAVGNGDAQQITDIIQSVKGDYKRNPQTGLNAVNFTSGNTLNSDIKAQTKLQLELDGFRVKDVDIIRENGNITISPYAERV